MKFHVSLVRSRDASPTSCNFSRFVGYKVTPNIPHHQFVYRMFHEKHDPVSENSWFNIPSPKPYPNRFVKELTPVARARYATLFNSSYVDNSKFYAYGAAHVLLSKYNYWCALFYTIIVEKITNSKLLIDCSIHCDSYIGEYTAET